MITVSVGQLVGTMRELEEFFHAYRGNGKRVYQLTKFVDKARREQKLFIDARAALLKQHDLEGKQLPDVEGTLAWKEYVKALDEMADEEIVYDRMEPFTFEELPDDLFNLSGASYLALSYLHPWVTEEDSDK